MAVVGLHNVSAFGPSLQMWRELEGENVMTQSYRSRQRTNGSDSECSNTPRSTAPGSDNGDDNISEDNHSVVSEDLGETERERVRKIFQEWLGEIGARRPIRRLCGRQTLLDLLLRAESERKRELQGLSEQRPVSEFAHRNRIQALLRGRFLRNDERSVLEKRPSSMAASELGLLRQRQTVSDLREGFLSKLDNSASFSSNSSDSSSNDENNEESQSTSMQNEVSPIHTESNLENTADTNPGPHELEVQVLETEDPVSNNVQEESTHVEQAEEINYSGPPYVLEGEDGQTTVDLEGNTNEEFEQQDGSWQQQNTVAFTDWRPENNVEEDQDQNQESHDDDWPSHDLQEAIDSWLDMPSGDVSSSLGRIDTFYFHDDDNNHSIELQELFSRRRVSSLLRSSFRASLDQVLQSHAERLSHANVDWELDNSSSPASIAQDQQQLNEDQNSELSDGAERNLFDPSSTLFTANQPLWDEELHDENWPLHSSNQQFGTEWEIINELRIDMARLQKRMNNMQNMLETCMDMQFELQRSVRQELSAALNRSGDESQKSCNRIDDESKWDDIRKGTCCLCRDSNIDSLLYRCGHMCTCTKCAKNLVQCMGKCPMCEAPVVEAVRAYFVQS